MFENYIILLTAFGEKNITVNGRISVIYYSQENETILDNRFFFNTGTQIRHI